MKYTIEQIELLKLQNELNRAAYQIDDIIKSTQMLVKNKESLISKYHIECFDKTMCKFAELNTKAIKREIE